MHKLTKARDDERVREAEAWLDLGNAAEALDNLDQLTSGGATTVEALRARYTALAAAEQWRFALLVSEVAVHMFPSTAETWLWRAHSIRALSTNAAKARDSLFPAADMFPEDPIILLNLALYEAELERAAEAAAWLERARRAALDTRMIEVLRTLISQDERLKGLWGTVDSR